MNSKAVVIAFANQKGGCGKSTVCRLLATQIWYQFPHSAIAIWDCDNPQYTNARLREMDLAMLNVLSNSGRQKRLLADYSSQVAKSPVYTIKEMDVNRIDRHGKEDLSIYDYILIDLPGKVDSAELAKVLPLTHFLFLPIDYDFGTVDSTVRYLKVLHGFAPHFRFPFVNNIHVFFNKIEKNQLEGTALPVAEDIMRQDLGIHFMEQVVLLRKNIKDDTLSTLFPLHQDSKVDNKHFYDFFKEFCGIIGLSADLSLDNGKTPSHE